MTSKVKKQIKTNVFHCYYHFHILISVLNNGLILDQLFNIRISSYCMLSRKEIACTHGVSDWLLLSNQVSNFSAMSTQGENKLPFDEMMMMMMSTLYSTNMLN